MVALGGYCWQLKGHLQREQEENSKLQEENHTLQSEKDVLQSENHTLQSEKDVLKEENHSLRDLAASKKKSMPSGSGEGDNDSSSESDSGASSKYSGNTHDPTGTEKPGWRKWLASFIWPVDDTESD